jgi:hypothetical protein
MYNKGEIGDKLIQLFEHVLKFNNFMFNCEHYLQISSTAMETKMAPSDANILIYGKT